jgi:hypothetical protein
MAQWNLDNLKKQFQGKELSGRDKRAMDYYGKLMPLFYRNDWFGFYDFASQAYCSSQRI